MKAKTYVIMIILSTLVISAGCESVALMPRPDIDPASVGHNRVSNGENRRAGIDRYRSPAAAGEVVGTVQRIDEAHREIHLRTRESNLVVFKYSPRTVVYDRDRELQIEALRSGDEVSVRPVSAGSTAEQYADVIRRIDRGPDARAYRKEY